MLTYQTGPDGRLYATGGHVDVDMGTEDTPEETITKMQAIVRAATAPADPSPQDVAVAANKRVNIKLLGTNMKLLLNCRVFLCYRPLLGRD